MIAVDRPPRHVSVIIEVPRWSFVKRELHDGSLVTDYVSPVPCPFNYGCTPDVPGADGDPQDVVVLGPRLQALESVTVPVVGVVRFVDAGRPDDKLVGSFVFPTAWQRLQLDGFFRIYALARRAINVVRGLTGSTGYGGLEISIRR